MTPLACAVTYAGLGWPVFPVYEIFGGACTCGKAACDDAGKHPRTSHGLRDATTDPEIINRWWTRWPNANVGIATGRVSGFFVLDEDPRHGGDESLAILEGANGDLPATVVAKTGGGGQHQLFMYPEDKAVRTTTKLGGYSGIDVRGEGGYIVAPPSNHISGGLYGWRDGPPVPDAIAYAPDWLLELLERRPQLSLPDQAAHDYLIHQGARNTTLTSLAGSMRWRGMSPASIEAALLQQNRESCRPPLSEDEVRRIAWSIARYEPDPNGAFSVISVNSVSGGWDHPVEFTAPLAGPPTPIEALPTPLADWATEAAESYQIALDFAATCAIGITSAAAARRAQVAVGETHREPLNLYLFPAGGPGERKVVLRAAAEPLEQLERELVEKGRPGIAQVRQERAFAEARIRALQGQAAKAKEPADRSRLRDEATRVREQMPVEVFEPRLLIDDATPEATALVLAQQGGVIAIVSEEAGSLFEILAGRYDKNASPNLDVHLKAYDGGTIRVNRIGRDPLIVEDPCLTILTTPQPSVLDRIAMLPDFRGRGLLGRCCFVMPESLVGSRLYQNRPIAAAASAAYHRTIDRLGRLPIARPRQAPLLVMRGVALAVWTQFANELEVAQAEGGHLAGIRDWASKHAGRAARLAGLFHLVRHTRADPWEIPICDEDVAMAWTIAQWLEGHALVAFERMGGNAEIRLARQILAWMRRHRLERFTLRDLYQHHRHVLSPAALVPGLEVLVGRGFLRPVEPPDPPARGRRPSPEYLVNPHTYSQKSPESQNSGEGDSVDLCEDESA